MKYYLLYSLLLLQFTSISAQPAGYYDPAAGLTGTALQQALHDIIDNHTVVTYTDLWTHFQTTDKRSDGKVWDMVVPGDELITLKQKYIVSSTIRRSDGVHVRVVSEGKPDTNAQYTPPNLEDTYLYFIGGAL